MKWLYIGWLLRFVVPSSNICNRRVAIRKIFAHLSQTLCDGTTNGESQLIYGHFTNRALFSSICRAIEMEDLRGGGRYREKIRNFSYPRSGIMKKCILFFVVASGREIMDANNY